MKKIIASPFLFLFFAALAWQCNPKKNASSGIPADVNAVLVLDMERLGGKAIEWKDLLSSEFWGKVVGEPTSGDILGKILTSGVDYNKKAYFFAKADPDLQASYAALVVSVKNVDKFERALKVRSIDKEKEGKFRFFLLHKGVLVAHNKRNAWVILAPQMGKEMLKETAKTAMNIKPEETLERKNASFATSLQTPADLTAWASYGNLPTILARQLKHFGVEIPSQFEPFLQVAQNVSSHTNFEKGEIKTSFKTFCNPESLKNYQKLLKGGIDAQLSQAIPIENPAMVMAVGVGVDGLEGLAGDSPTIKGAKLLLGMAGTSVKDILGLYTGDAVLAIGNLQRSYDFGEQEVFLVLGTKNAEEAQKTITNFNGFLRIKKRENYLLLDLDDYHAGEWFVLTRGNQLCFTPSAKLRDAFLEGKQKLNPQTQALFNGKVAVMELDYNQIARNLTAVFTETGGAGEQIAETFERFQITTKPWANNVWEGESVVKMKDKSRNAFPIVLNWWKKLPKVQQ